MQNRLRGDLEDYSATWGTWKEWLRKAFPRTTDFFDRLEQMLARQKWNETMNRYYNDKISLMKKCGLDGENAILCLIRGFCVRTQKHAATRLPKNYITGFFRHSKTTGLKKTDDLLTKKVLKSTWQRGSTAGYPAPKVCYNCRRPGHEARDCRAAPATRCQVCHRVGHAANTSSLVCGQGKLAGHAGATTKKSAGLSYYHRNYFRFMP